MMSDTDIYAAIYCMNYKKHIEKLSNELSDCVEWSRQEGDVANKMYMILGISRTSHVQYMQSEESVPEYINHHLETLTYLPADLLAKIALQRMMPGGFIKKTLKEIASLAMTQWEIATGAKFNESSSSASFVDDWKPVAATRQMSKKLSKKDGDLLVLNSLYKQIKNLKVYVSSRSASEESLIAVGKLEWLLSLGTVQSFRDDYQVYLENMVRRFKGELSDEDIAFLKTLPTESLEAADSDFTSMKKVSMAVGAKASGKIVYSKLIFSFDSIEDLVSNVLGLPDGFALCSIKNANPADSYFVIVIKDGENVTLLSDMGEYSDPLMESRMARRNNRYNAFRQDGSYLPYELLNLLWEDNDRHVKEASSSTTVVDPRTNIRVIGNFSQLSVEQTLWFGRVVELSYEAYFKNSKQESALGILTANRLQIGEKLMSNNKSELPACVVVGSISLPESKDLNRACVEKHFPEIKNLGGANKWMEKKFAKQVPSQFLYRLPEVENDCLRLSVKSKSGDLLTLPVKDERVVSLPITKLYTSEEAIASSIFIGRHNQVAAIEQLVIQDFKDNRRRIFNWVNRHIANNIPNLIDDLVMLNHSRFYLSRAGDKVSDSKVRQVHFVKMGGRASGYIRDKASASELIKRLGLYSCGFANCYIAHHMYDDYEDSNYGFVLNIDNVWDIINVTGIAFENLPVELQNYRRPKFLRNTILDTHDPLDLIQNPWDKLSFTFALPVSKKFVNRRRKELGASGISSTVANFWEREDESRKLCQYIIDAGGIVSLPPHPPSYMHYLTCEMERFHDV